MKKRGGVWNEMDAYVEYHSLDLVHLCVVNVFPSTGTERVDKARFARDPSSTSVSAGRVKVHSHMTTPGIYRGTRESAGASSPRAGTRPHFSCSTSSTAILISSLSNFAKSSQILDVLIKSMHTQPLSTSTTEACAH